MGRDKRQAKGRTFRATPAVEVVPKTGQNGNGEERKLTKQERRNLNRKLREQQTSPLSHGTAPSSNPSQLSSNTQPPTETISVYKRQTIYPSSYTFPSHIPSVTNRFIEETHPEFNNIVDASYRGFAMDGPEDLSTEFHSRFQTALRELDSQGFYQFDYTQPGGLGTKVAKTYVTRCLVGDPGLTYKYLGLRMFAYPWTKDVLGSTPTTLEIGCMNRALSERSLVWSSSGKDGVKQLQENLSEMAIGGLPPSSAAFNLTLINRCYPRADPTVRLKLEPVFGTDPCTVSWHADSCLDHFSTIAVYHFNENPEKSSEKKPWRVSLRVSLNAEGPHQNKPAPITVDAPPLAVNLPKECIYYLLDDFNHHHQHSVLAGDSHRYASTHRVSRKEGHTYQYIIQRTQAVLQERIAVDAKSIRRLMLVASEVEFEWIRQFYIQGEAHRQRHVWWHRPMEELLSALIQIERRAAKIVAILGAAANVLNSSREETEGDEEVTSFGRELKKVRRLIPSVEISSYQEMITQLKDRVTKRRGWEDRERDPIYETCNADTKPIPVPFSELDSVWDKLSQLAPPETRRGKKGTPQYTRGIRNFDGLLSILPQWETAFTANPAQNMEQ